MIPPRPPEFERGREHFKIRTSPAFDALAPAEAAAQHTLQFLFNPVRTARLVEFHARTRRTQFGRGTGCCDCSHLEIGARAGYDGAIARAVDDVALYDLLALATNDGAAPEVRAIAGLKLHQLKAWAAAPAPSVGEDEQAHRAQAVRQIEQFERDPRKLNCRPRRSRRMGRRLGARLALPLERLTTTNQSSRNFLRSFLSAAQDHRVSLFVYGSGG